MAKVPNERVKPRFGKKTKTERAPTKRHLQDKLKSAKANLQRWELRDSNTNHRSDCVWKNMITRLVKVWRAEVKMLEELIAEKEKV